MLGIDNRAARYTWTVAVITVLLLLVYLIRSTVFVFILALLFAYLLSPLVNFLYRALPAHWTRTPALALAYIIFVGLVILIGAEIGSRVVDEANTLAKRLPDMLAGLQKPSPTAPAAVNSLKAQIVERIRVQIEERTGDVVAAISKAGLKVLTLASELIYVVVIPILAFFFLKDAPMIRQHILETVEDGPQRDLLDDLLADVHLLLAHYMRALVLLGLATFAAYSIFFGIVGVPYAVLLAALAGLLEIIPMLGPLTAGIATLLVTGVSGGPVLTVLIFLLAYRLFQDYILSPHLMGHGVELHPLLVLFGVFAGAEVAGIPGAFLSVPVLALGHLVYVRVRKSRLGTRLTPRTPVSI